MYCSPLPNTQQRAGQANAQKGSGPHPCPQQPVPAEQESLPWAPKWLPTPYQHGPPAPPVLEPARNGTSLSVAVRGVLSDTREALMLGVAQRPSGWGEARLHGGDLGGGWGGALGRTVLVEGAVWPMPRGRKAQGKCRGNRVLGFSPFAVAAAPATTAVLGFPQGAPLAYRSLRRSSAPSRKPLLKLKGKHVPPTWSQVLR